MGARYGRKASDGVTEYYDYSREELCAAEEREFGENLKFWFGLVGLLVGGVCAYLFLNLFAASWPKIIRFSLTALAGGGGAYLLARLAHVILMMFAFLMVLAVVVGIGTEIWRAL